MKREIDIALDTQKELLLRIIENPKEFKKLPKKGLLLPKDEIVSHLKILNQLTTY